jgi:hypothetical protein
LSPNIDHPGNTFSGQYIGQTERENNRQLVGSVKYLHRETTAVLYPL